MICCVRLLVRTAAQNPFLILTVFNGRNGIADLGLLSSHLQYTRCATLLLLCQSNFVIDAFANEHSGQRCIDADVALLGIKLICADNAVAMGFSAIVQQGYPGAEKNFVPVPG